MKLQCPKCNYTNTSKRASDRPLKKDGKYYRSSDRKWVQRYRCQICRTGFSSSTLYDCYKQKKRSYNSKVARLLVGSVSMREAARILGINRKTVVRKLIFMGHRAKRDLALYNLKKKPAVAFQFDDMETFEHSKCKPISISLAVEDGSRRILAYEVAQMPSKGLLAITSVKKYGKRKDHRPEARQRLLCTLQKNSISSALIKTDESTHYVKDIKKYFPNSEHRAYKGRKSSIGGQGELKKIGFDPLFSLNHTAAVARYRVSRLVRKTWSTTKKIERLDLHFALLAMFHNLNLDRMATKAAG